MNNKRVVRNLGFITIVVCAIAAFIGKVLSFAVKCDSMISSHGISPLSLKDLVKFDGSGYITYKTFGSYQNIEINENDKEIKRFELFSVLSNVTIDFRTQDMSKPFEIFIFGIASDVTIIVPKDLPLITDYSCKEHAKIVEEYNDKILDPYPFVLIGSFSWSRVLITDNPNF